MNHKLINNFCELLYLLCYSYQEKNRILLLLSKLFGTKKEQDNKSLSDARITEFPKIPIVPRNKTHKKQRRLRRVKRRYKKKYPKFRSKLRIISNPKKQLHPKPWNSFSSYSPSDPYYAPTSTPFKLSSQSQIRTPAITHVKFNFPPQSPLQDESNTPNLQFQPESP